MSEAHARLGPSNKRWPSCPGSIREEERYPDIPGAAAIDGTGSHLLLELCLKNNVVAAQYDQQIIGANHQDNPNGWLVDVDRIERVQQALDYIKRRSDELKQWYPGCNVLVESESKADPGGAFGRDDWWGTCDVTIMARHPHSGEVYFIEVIDYKDGRGYVSEKNNTQNISYLFGKMRKYVCSGPDLVRPFKPDNVHNIRMTIIQPKTNPSVRYVCSTRPEDEVSTASVVEDAINLSNAADRTDDPDAPLIPGNHCQWCKANPKRGGHCTANTEKSLETVNIMSNIPMTGSGTKSDTIVEYLGNVMADPKSLTEDELSQLADAEAGIQAVFDKVKAEIKERIEQGITVPGYAMEPGNGSNVWNEDEEVVVKKLKALRLKKDDIYPAKLISTAQFMKLDNISDKQKERIKNELITYTAGKLSLKKVAHPVAQSNTDDVKSVEMMFADVPKLEQQTEEVSFF